MIIILLTGFFFFKRAHEIVSSCLLPMGFHFQCKYLFQNWESLNWSHDTRNHIKYSFSNIYACLHIHWSFVNSFTQNVFDEYQQFPSSNDHHHIFRCLNTCSLYDELNQIIHSFILWESIKLFKTHLNYQINWERTVYTYLCKLVSFKQKISK